MIQVVNRHNHVKTLNDYYVGRGTPLGNPFKVETCGREYAIEQYKDYLCKEIFSKNKDVIAMLRHLAKLHLQGQSINLVCSCVPNDCHANYIRDIILLKCNYRKLKYAGVGARATPNNVCERMKQIAWRLYYLGYTLRSGGARGADKAFEDGHDLVCGETTNKEIFYAKHIENDEVSRRAMEMASSIHPNWGACNDDVRRLHARNCLQILGKNLQEPVDFVVCWTQGGETVGGTATAIRLAEMNNIPIFNLALKDFEI